MAFAELAGAASPGFGQELCRKKRPVIHAAHPKDEACSFCRKHFGRQNIGSASPVHENPGIHESRLTIIDHGYKANQEGRT